MTKNYEDAVEEGQLILHFGEDITTEHIVAIGYRAGLQDAVKALNEAGAVQPSSEGSRRLYAIAKDKMASVARKFETRAKDLGV